MSVHNVIYWRVFFYVKFNCLLVRIDNKRHIKRKRKSIAENLAYPFWQYFDMNVNKRKNYTCLALWKHHVNLLLQSFRSVSSDLHKQVYLYSPCKRTRNLLNARIAGPVLDLYKTGSIFQTR